MSASNFKVIVVGGGPVGMVAAHALTHAGIDFVVLESRDHMVIDAGSNLVLTPIGLRVLGQLGLLEALDAVTSPLGKVHRIDHQGRDIGNHEFFNLFNLNHGRNPRVVSRRELTKVLYESLPEDKQACMLPKKRVSNISTTATGVTVTCRDGSSYDGSIVIGADGAHSMVRDCMRNLAVQASNNGVSQANVNDEHPFLTTYRCMWVRFPTQADLQPGDANETHGPNAAVQLFAGEETTVIGIYERMEAPTRERTRFTAADEEAFVNRLGHLPISGELTIRDAYERRVKSGGAGMVSLEEGVVNHWYSHDSRIVLAGDACHKFTPSTGAGCNNGIVDIVALVNSLNQAVQTAAPLAPSQDKLSQALAAYQAARYDAVKAGCAGASQATSAATWENAAMRFVDRHIFPHYRLQKFMAKSNAQAVARSPVFDFIEGEEQLVGNVPWVHSIPARSTVLAN